MQVRDDEFQMMASAAVEWGGDPAICAVLADFARICGRCVGGLPDGGFSSDGHLLLDAGMTFKRKRTPTPKGMLGPAKGCFRTAATWALANPKRWVYCEGYAVDHRLGVPMHHAWLVDRKDGLAIEVTESWDRSDEISYLGLPLSAEATRMIGEQGEPFLLRPPGKSPILSGQMPMDAWWHAAVERLPGLGQQGEPHREAR